MPIYAMVFAIKKLQISLGLVAISFLLAAQAPECSPNQTFSIMSANLTSGNNSAYESPGIRIFQGLDPDIVLIQEFNYHAGTLRDFVDEAFGSEFDYFVEPGDDFIPNGIVSRYPILAAGEWADDEISDRDFAWAIIDIPGEINLQAVSVHLRSGSDGSENRNNEANAIKAYVQDRFNMNQYIVVGGDLNTYSSTEPAVNTFRTFLDVDSHTPVDQAGNKNTSEPRTKRYDWIMPNGILDEGHTTLQIGRDRFPEGLVFDSNVYPPPLPNPIQPEDSHVEGMQHMPVMRAFML